MRLKGKLTLPKGIKLYEMKKLITTLIVALTVITASAQNQEDSTTFHAATETVVAYKLFPTTNMWTFIKLNTRNGKMWQVQYSMNDNRFETYLNLLPLVSRANEANGRFTLYSTQNMWTFILLDQIDGRMWQVHWSQETEKRGIIPIE